MQRKTFLASTLALLIAGLASLAMAQNDAAPPAPAAGPGMHAMQHAPGMMGDHRPRGHGMRGMRGGDSDVIADLRDLERLYRESGRSKELPALYNEVLGKSQDPRVRAYAYHHLARAQARPANVDAAIATLRKSLDENLANEAKHRAEMEKMRARWEQQRASAPAAK